MIPAHPARSSPCGGPAAPRLRASLAEWFDAAASLLFPPACRICLAGRASHAGGYVCAACREEVRRVGPPFCNRCGLPFEGEITTQFECANCREMELHFEFARAAALTRGPVVGAVHGLKYRNAPWFVPFLGDLLCEVIAPEHARLPVGAFIPVPLHPLRQRERGYNQAELLARHAAGRFRSPLLRDAVRRVKDTPTQTRLDRRQRTANVRGAFTAGRRAREVQGLHVALVDDVLTTGATTSACARALLDAGAASVRVFTVARAVGSVA